MNQCVVFPTHFCGLVERNLSVILFLICYRGGIGRRACFRCMYLYGVGDRGPSVAPLSAGCGETALVLTRQSKTGQLLLHDVSSVRVEYIVPEHRGVKLIQEAI